MHLAIKLSHILFLYRNTHQKEARTKKRRKSSLPRRSRRRPSQKISSGSAAASVIQSQSMPTSPLSRLSALSRPKSSRLSMSSMLYDLVSIFAHLSIACISNLAVCFTVKRALSRIPQHATFLSANKGMSYMAFLQSSSLLLCSARLLREHD